MFSWLSLLGAVFALMTLVWLVIMSCLISRAGSHFRQSRLGRVLHGAMGGVFVLLGLRLASEQR